jgi:photosystem II stability/assembly factor-like uncharacterized protein
VGHLGGTRPRDQRRAVCAAAVAAVLCATGCLGLRAVAGAAAPARSSATLGYIAFLSLKSGYGYFVVQGQAQCRGEVGPTHDGGAVFGPLVQVTSWNCGNGPPARYLTFDGRGDGFLYGPGLFITHDGGRTWAAGALQGSVVSMGAVGRSVWAVATRCATPARPECRLVLLRSADGGRSWTVSRAPNIYAGPDEATFGEAGQSWLVRPNASTAYVVSLPATSQTRSVTGAILWVTTDGGATWSERAVPCGIYAFDVALAVAPDRTLFAACAGQPSAGFQPKSVLRSVDGGRRWALEVRCVLVPRASAGCRSPLNDGYLGGMVALSARTVFLFGARSSLLLSRDGGARWGATRPPVGDTSGGSGPAYFFGLRQGVVLANDPRHDDAPTIWVTRDGGFHWRSVVPRSWAQARD